MQIHPHNQSLSRIIVLFGLVLATGAHAANTADNFTGGATGSLLVTGNWSLSALPLVGNDAVFTSSSGGTGIRPLSAGTLTVGSFDVTATTGTFTINNQTSTSTSSTLTLGGSGDNGNGVSGTAADLLYVASGATFNINGPNGSTGSGVLNVALGQSGNINAAGTMTISSAISGSGFGITKTGAGTLTLSGANTYSAGTTINAGNVTFSPLNAVPGSGLIKVNSGGALNASGAYTTVANWLASGKVDTTSAGAIAITAANSETLNFSANGYGALYLGANGAFTYSGTLTPSSSGYLLGGGGGTLTVSSALNSSGSALTANGSGTVVLSGNNTYTGSTTVSGGTLKLGAAGALGNGTLNTSGVTVGGSGIFDFGGISPTYAAPFTLNSTANAFDVGAIENSSGTAVTFGGAVTLQRQTRFGGGGTMLFTGGFTGGGFNLIKDSVGLLELQNSGTVTLGAFQANRGTLQVDSGTTLNVTSIDVGTGSSVGAGLTLNGGSMISSGLSRFGNGAGSASGTLTLNSGTLTVPALTKGGVTFNANFNGGTLKASGDSATFFSSATLAKIQAGGAVIDDGGFAVTISQPLTDTAASGGGLTKQGAGTLTLSGANNFVGATTISGGTLKAGVASALGFGGIHSTAISSVGGTTVNNGFTLDLNGLTINEPITINGTGVGGNGALINSSGTPAIVGNGIAGITVSAIGTVGPLAAISFSGTGSGATAVAVGGVTAASFTISSGTTTYSAAPAVAISGGGGSGATATATLSGGLVTSITITAAGTGYTSAPTIAFSGGTVLVAGTNPTGTGNANNFTPLGVQTTAAGSGYTGATTYSFTGGNGTWTPGNVALSSVVLASDSSIGGSGGITINAVISQSGGTRSLTKVGAGTLTLNGLNTYGGTTTVSAGKLAVTSAQTTTGNLTVSDGANLTVTISGSSQLSPNTLTLGTTTGATLEFNSLTSAALTTASLNPTAVTANGTTSVKINSASGLSAGNSYKLISNAGSLAAYNLVTQPAGVTGTLAISSGTLVYTVTSVSDIWNAAAPGGNWDVGTTANWAGNAVNNSPVNTYKNGDSVLLDDTVSGPNTVTVAAAVTPSAVLVNNNSTAYTIASSGANLIGGSATFTKIGSASLTLSGGVNTYSGATVINGGTVSVGVLANGSSASDIGSSSSSAANLTLNGGALKYTGAATSSDRLLTVGTAGATLDASGSGALNLNNSGAVVLSSSGPRTVALTGTSTSANTLAPSLADNGGATAVSKSGAGSWTLAGANSYSGATDLSAGTLALSGSGTLGNGSSALTVSGGTLDLGGLTSPTVGTVTISGGTIQNGTLSASSYAGQSGTISAILAGSGVSLTKTTSGILTLSGANTYSGVTTVSAGTLQLQNPSAIANSAFQYASGSTLSLRSDANATFLTTGVTVAANNNPFVWNLDVNNLNAGNTGNTLILQKVGQLMGANAFTMSTLNVSGGNGYTLQMGSGAAGTGAINFWNNLTLNSTTAGVTLSIPGGLAVNAGFSYTLPLGGAGNLSLGPLTRYPGNNLTPTFGGSGTITLNGANNFGAAAGIISTTGTLALNNNGALTGLSTLALNSAVTLDNTSSGTVTISGTPAQTWSSDFTFGSGNTTGSLNLGTGTVALGATRNITVASSTYGLTVGGIISGSGFGLNKTGPGSLTLTGVNTFTGGISNNAGTLTIGGSGQLGGGTYSANITNSGTFVYNSSAAQTLNGQISGTGALTEQGSGTLTLSGANTYTGTTTISAGTLALGASGTLPTATTVNLAGGTLDMSTFNNTVNALQSSGSILAKGTWGASGSGANHISTSMTGTGILTVTAGGASTSVVTSSANPSTYGSVTFTNTVTGSNGDGSAPDGAVTFYDGATALGAGTFVSSAGTVSTYTLTVNSLAVGTHSITASYDGNASYDVSTSGALSQGVNPAISTATVTVNNSPATYNGLGQAATVTLSGTNTVGSVTNILTGGQTLQTNAGSYAVTATFVPADTNYTTLSLSSSNNFVINQATNTLFSNLSSVTNSYGATNILLTGTISATGPLYPAIGETVSATINGITVNGKVIDGAGNFSINTNSLFLGTNGVAGSPYAITYNYSGNLAAADSSTTLVITNALLGITANGDSKTYDGNSYNTNNGVTYTGLVNGETSTNLAGTLSFGGTSQGATNAGSYSIVPSGLSSSNYAISYTNGTLTINPLAIAVMADGQTKVYGSSDPALTYSNTPALVAGDSFSGALSRASGENVGSYAITQGSLGLSANYTLNYTGADLAITPASLTVTANSTSKNYGQTVTFAGTEFTSSGLQFSDSVSSATITSTGATNTSGVGSYPIGISGASGTGLGNYNITYHDGTLTVNPATLLVQADNAGRGYGATNPVFTASYSGFVNSETPGTSDVGGAPTLVTAADTNSPVGTYDIAAALGSLTSTNYSFVFSNGTLTVAAALLTVTADNQTRAYGAANPALTASYSGFVNGDTSGVLTGAPAVTTTADTNSPVGGYTITAAAGTLSATNYAFTLVNGTLTINQTPLGITANNASKAYDGLGYTGGNGVSYAGFVNGETSAVLGGTLAYGGTSQNATNASGYTIVPSGLTSTNYAITYNNGALTVNPLGVTVTADAQTKVYGAMDPALSYTYAPGLVAGDSFSGALSRAAGENVGSYAIGQNTLSLSANYALSYNGANLVITPAATLVMLVVGNPSVVYSGAGQSATVSVTASNTPGGVVNILAGGQTLQTNVGTYAVTADYVPADTNYTTLTGIAVGSFTITPASSSNAYLLSLAITPAGALSPGFTTNGFSYTATNAYVDNPVSVTAISADTNATLRLRFNGGSFTPLSNNVASGNNTLLLPTNTVEVQVVSPDLSQTNVYTVNVWLQPSQTVPQLVNSVSGNTMTLSWPADHLGYRLLVQTNSLDQGVSGNPNDWGTVPGTTATNSISIPISTGGVTNEFYRLVYP